MIWLLLVTQAAVSASGLLALRHFLPLFMNKGIHSEISVWGGTLLGVFLYGISFLAWLFILSKYQVSFAYPFTIGVTLALTVIGAIILFRENVTVLQILGMCILVVAIFLISSNSASR
ncbi:hypothetical protein [Aurantimicrobium minutum]|uniref:hypothetical protein n=1 Tax=Aurantimicrobium minutum TaxID=708131 RepID=UPI002476BFA3|nr:hypothetical protein [Aurantimicrobium minutum]MDH6208293.1 drug/metabolite transporter (DMT)-like permease [Aurantimicrobium minutum]